MPEIIPIRDLKNTNAISQRCHETQEPIFVTKSGYRDMVIMSIRAPRMLSGEFLFMATPHNSRLTMRVPQPDIIEHFGNADAVPQPPERCLSRTSGAKAPRTLRPLPLLRFAVSATGGAHLCSIQYYRAFWLGICRTSLAVSALRIMRYCLVLFYPFPCCFSTVATGFTNRKHIPPATALATASICRAGRSSS